jgi:hypothetical protein
MLASREILAYRLTRSTTSRPMFVLEINTFGVVAPPGQAAHAVFIIRVCELISESTWLVYRPYATCLRLYDMLAVLQPAAPAPPSYDERDLSHTVLSAIAGDLQTWLRQLLLYPLLKESPALRKFLCQDASSPPQHMRVFRSGDSSLEDMNMDEMFRSSDTERWDEDEWEPEHVCEEPSSRHFTRHVTRTQRCGTCLARRR